ncbi:hypothetical protein [Streptacidiphilus neutrinimicus]|uniref:hypothetical protein n=1 Tax=Streptacidiphilus neutrinimicus TaxID=105420 RepID=UPI0005A92A2A|nr:hypothetical protein [Streptacidiphilus neutrinimicus]
MTTELASAHEIHAYLVDGLNQALRRSGVRGGEIHLTLVLDLLLFAERRQGDWGEVLHDELGSRDAVTSSGVQGAFRKFLPADQGHAVASVYAEIAQRQGWLRLDRVLDDDEYGSMLDVIDSWASRDRVWEDVTSTFGPPSIVFGGSNPLYSKTLGYATGEPSDPMLFLHLWNGSEPEAQSSWPPAYEQPLLLAVRRGDAPFSTAFTFTPEGLRRRPACLFA